MSQSDRTPYMSSISTQDLFMKHYLPHRYPMITIAKPGYMTRVQKELLNVYGRRISQQEAQTWIDAYRTKIRQKFSVQRV